LQARGKERKKFLACVSGHVASAKRGKRKTDAKSSEKGESAATFGLAFVSDWLSKQLLFSDWLVV